MSRVFEFEDEFELVCRVSLKWMVWAHGRPPSM